MKLHEQLLLLQWWLPLCTLLQLLAVVHAFPSHAGGCYAGPAVSGRHIADNGGRRIVTTGSLMERNIDVYVDGTLVATSETTDAPPLVVSMGMEHVLELVASQPFKGALLRVESTTTDFVVTPLINAQVAVDCDKDIVQGVSHANSNLKNAFSASFTATGDDDADFIMDITVVDYNNATASVYWYSQFRFVTSSDNGQEPTPTPVSSPSAIPSVTKLDTVPPTITSYPTYHERCLVCGANPDAVVRRPTQHIDVMGESATCGELQQDGASGLIPMDMCGVVQTAARAHCDCGALDLSATAATTVPDGSPTVAPYPYEKCFICGVNGEVTLWDTLVTVRETTGTCFDLQQDGHAGYLSYEMCRDAIRVAVVHCACARLAPSTSQTAVTLTPSVTPYPTVTAYPSYTEKCLVCGEGTQVTAVDQIVSVRGDVGTCLELEQQGAAGFVNPSLCADAQAVAAKQCQCDIVPSSPMGVKTFTPTVTPFPTVSFNPTFGEKCLVCGHGKRPTLLDVIVVVDNLAITCRELATAGRDSEIPPSVCPDALSVAQALCGCR